MIEIQTFRCKGAPDGVFKRAMLYANVINSPSSNVMPDDIELYNRCQEGNATQGGEWVSMHRYHGSDRSDAEGLVSVNGTSELPMRNQFSAWKTYMEAGAVATQAAAGDSSCC